ncbi:hypothetical protein DW178_03365 [Eggerthella sp. AM16-19]|nr:hypothetical protein DW178_03365 [Eggerthella sp. AM16-19]
MIRIQANQAYEKSFIVQGLNFLSNSGHFCEFLNRQKQGILLAHEIDFIPLAFAKHGTRTRNRRRTYKDSGQQS